MTTNTNKIVAAVFAASAALASTGANAATSNVDAVVNTGLLPPVCSFSNPNAGTGSYSFANHQFTVGTSGDTPPTIDLYWRNPASGSKFSIAQDGTTSAGTIITGGVLNQSLLGTTTMQFNDGTPVAGSILSSSRTGLDSLLGSEWTQTVSVKATMDLDPNWTAQQNVAVTVPFDVLCIQ